MKNKYLLIWLLAVVFFYSHTIKAQPMNAFDIIKNLYTFWPLLNNIHHAEQSHLKDKSGFIKLSKQVSSQYNFITLQLQYHHKEDKDQTQPTIDNYCEVTFEITDNRIVFKELYVGDESRYDDLKKIIHKDKTVNNTLWNQNNSKQSAPSLTITNYLTLADTIANEAVNCTSGDDYRPGNYSKVTLDDEFISLHQINYMNSRSLDHKEDYSMRNLEFIIPIAESRKDSSRYDYQIGEMLINLSDNSSKNNKHCGQVIKEKIEQMKRLFDTK